MSGNFIKSIAILSGSNLLAQVINFITYLILPKYYFSPAEFGVFGMFLAIYFILFEVINLKMDQAIMLPESEKQAAGLLGFSWMVAFILSLIILVVLIAANAVFHWFDAVFPFLVTISLILGGFIQPALVFLNRQSAYFKMGNVRIAQAIMTLAGSIAGYYWIHDTMNGLIIGFIAGQLLAAILLIFLVNCPGVHIAGKDVVRKYMQFIRYGSLSALINTLSRNLPAFVIKPVFGDAALGWYTLAVKYLNAPVGIFSASVGQVYYKDASKASPDELSTLTRKVITNILALAVIPVLLLLVFGGGIFEYVFGAEWQQAGVMIQVMVLWYFVAYASGPVSMLLDVKLKLDWELSYNFLLLVGRSLALLSAVWIRNVYYVLAIYTVVGVIFNLFLLNYILALSKPHAKA